MYKNLDAAKKGLLGYVGMKEIKNGTEPAYHVIQANQTLNPKLQVLPDENYMISSESYVNQLKEYWKEKNTEVEVKVLATEKTTPDA